MSTEFPLTFMHSGETKQVVGVRCDSPARDRLIEMGFRKGVEVRLLEVDETICRVGVNGTEVQLVPWVASSIYVGED